MGAYELDIDLGSGRTENGRGGRCAGRRLCVEIGSIGGIFGVCVYDGDGREVVGLVVGRAVLEFEGGLEVHELAHEDYVGSDDWAARFHLVVGVVHVQIEFGHEVGDDYGRGA